MNKLRLVGRRVGFSMANIWHLSWLKEGVTHWNKRRKIVSFYPDLSGTRLFECLPDDFRDAPKTSRFFERIDLSGADLSGSDLSNLNFSGAKFRGANLRNADMSMSNFSRADFTGADVSGAKFENSYFDEAIFDRAIVTDVDFTDLDFQNTVFRRTALNALQAQQVYTLPSLNPATDLRSEVLDVSNRSSYVTHSSIPQIATPKNNLISYPVYFCTSRTPIYTRGYISTFSSQVAADVTLGVCEVVIPKERRIGTLGSSLFRRLLRKKDDRIKLEHIVSLNDDLFWKFINDGIAMMRKKEVPTLFVHGFRNTFEDAVIRSAQLGYDIGLGQGIGLFSWPSKGTLTGYASDEATSESSKYVLADFIEAFVKNTSAASINVIAHSMGCRCLLGAIEVLSNGRVSTLKKLNQLIFAAADVDSTIMPKLSRSAIKYSKRVTSYVSDKDSALKISGWLHSYPRVGVCPPTFVTSGMDTVLVNDLDLGDFKHNYFASSRTMLSDIFEVLKRNSAPHERHSIEVVVADGLKYWRIRN